ncbi:MAG: branched-chain amino acid ABC transporter permease [Hyphomonadaceae bacterium]|jgi:branched-chain amino acid transport system permease protein/neutral amino acid transport system permease protein|nr:branched-chain amino acid ABC transporter permease [Hyphomonadaceae bacterium]
MQVVVNALASAAIIAPAAVGFTLTFMLFRYANFAVGAFVMLGAFAAWTVNVTAGLPLWAGGIAALAIGAMTVALSDRLVFRPLQGRTGATLLLVSVALSFVLENVIRFFYGSQIKGFDLPLTGPLMIGDLRITREALAVVTISGIAILSTAALLTLTPIGRALRAVADNTSLADVRGLPVGSIQTVGMIIAGALFGLSGTLVGIDLAIDPGLSWAVTIPIIAAAIFGGLGSPLGAALGALAIGFAEELTVMFLAPAYKGAVGFMVIVVVLLLRPQGLLGVAVDRK